MVVSSHSRRTSAKPVRAEAERTTLWLRCTRMTPSRSTARTGLRRLVNIRHDRADLVAALAGAHLGRTHRGCANTVGMLIDLDRYLDILGRGPELDHSLECLAADPLQI